MGFLAALAGLASPILARVLVALGFSVVTIWGVSAAVDVVKAKIMYNLGGASLAALQIAGLAGVWDALGYMFTSVTFTVMLWGLTKAVRIVGG